MAIKSGSILHDSRGFVVDRIQSGGVSNLNIPLEKIYETGNYSSVTTLRDIPELQFELESLDVSTETEALINGLDPATVTTGQKLDFINSLPMDIVSPFKAGNGAFNIVKGIVIPYLSLDSVTYRFGVRQNSTQTFSLRGDSLYYIPGTPKIQEFTITAGANQVYAFANTAIAYTETGTTLYALSVCAKNTSTGIFKRLFFGDDFTNTPANVTVLANLFTQGYNRLHVTYGTATAATYNSTVHQGATVKPGAVRGKDVCVYVSDGAATPTLLRWTGIQTFEATRSVNLEADEELCNTHYVSYDYDIAEVKGTIGLKPFNYTDLFDKIAQVSNVSTSVIAGPYSSAALEILVKIKDPDTGVTLKTIDIPDARFTLPAIQPRANTKLETTFNWESDSGTMYVYRGDKP